MKSANIWRCIDCHKLGFYYGMTDQEIHDKHAKECDAREEIVLPPSKWPNGGDEGGAEL